MNGNLYHYLVRRLKCSLCNRIHHELPNFIVPYKQYCVQVIEAAIEGEIIDLPCYDNTIVSFQHWFASQLEAHQAAVLRNYYFEGYSWQEIESLTGVSYKTLVRHKKDALKALTQSYQLLKSLGVIDTYNKTPTLLQ